MTWPNHGGSAISETGGYRVRDVRTAIIQNGTGTLQFARYDKATGAFVADIAGATGTSPLSYTLTVADQPYAVHAYALIYMPGGIFLPTEFNVPIAATNVIATPNVGGGAVTLSYTAPADTAPSNGGSTITSLTAVDSRTGTVYTLTGSPFTISGLNNGEGRMFTVYVNNAIGASIGARSNFVTPADGEWATRLWAGNVSFSTAKNFFQTVGTMADGGFGTIMIVTELMGDATAVQIPLHNYDTVSALSCVSVKAICVGALGDLKYDAAFAAIPDAVIEGTATTMSIPVRSTVQSNAHPTIKNTLSIPITTVPRTDGGTLPLVAWRVVYQFPTPSTTNFGYWAPVGTLWDTDAGLLRSCARVGDFRTTAIDSAAAGQSAFRQCGAIGLRVKYKTKAMTVAAFGSSITKGDLPSLPNKRAAGYVGQAAIAVSTPTKPIEYMNLGFAGFPNAQAAFCAADYLPLFQPNHVAVEVMNVNNMPSTDTTVSEINTLRTQAQTIYALADSIGAKKIVFNSHGRNQSGSPYTGAYYTAAATAKQTAYLAEWNIAGYTLLDTRTGMDTGEVPDRVKMAALGYPADYLNPGEATTVHQTDAANTAVYKPQAAALFTTLQAAYPY